jgi:hypothetical protein
MLDLIRNERIINVIIKIKIKNEEEKRYI